MRPRDWHRLIAPLRRRVRALVTRGVAQMIDTSTLMQTLQVELLSGELLDGIEHAEPYGYTAHAPADGAEVIAVAVGGERDHTVVISIANRQFRLTGLQEGEVALYDDQGQIIALHRGGIDIQSPNPVNVTTDGDVTVTAGGNALVDATEVHLAGADGDVVTTAHTCAFTGNPHPAGSSKVKAGA